MRILFILFILILVVCASPLGARAAAAPTFEQLSRELAALVEKLETLRAEIELLSKPRDIAWGVYAGNRREQLTKFTKLVSTTPDLYAIFWGWDDTFPTAFDVLGRGKTLVIFWEPSFDYDHINDGSKDRYIAAFARGARAYTKQHELILVPFSEMNLGAHAWGDTGDNTPQEFIAAWRRVHTIFKKQRADDVRFGLAYNVLSTGPHTSFADYYPGDAYVDYVGLDGFNWVSGSETPSDVFSAAAQEVASFNKPLYIFSTAAAEGVGKAAWIDAFGAYTQSMSNLHGWIWFNVDKEESWQVDSNLAALAAFKRLVRSIPDS